MARTTKQNLAISTLFAEQQAGKVASTKKGIEKQIKANKTQKKIVTATGKGLISTTEFEQSPTSEPKWTTGTGVTHYKPKGESPIPSRQSAVKRSKYSTGNFWERYGKRVNQNLSDLKRVEQSKKLTSVDFLEGTNDKHTSDEQWTINNAVSRTAIDTSDLKRTKTGNIVKTRATEQPIISFKTKQGVITLPKTKQLRGFAQNLGITTKSTEPKVLRHKIQRGLTKAESYAEQYEKAVGLTNSSSHMSGIVKPLHETKKEQTTGSPEIKHESPVQLKLPIIHGAMKTLDEMRGFQKEYAKTYIEKDKAEANTAMHILAGTNPEASNVKTKYGAEMKKDTEANVNNRGLVSEGENVIQTRADILSGKGSMELPETDKKGNIKYTNKIFPASKFERKVEVSTEGKVKTTHTGNVNPVYEKGVEATAPWAAAGNKAFVDLTPLKIAKESGGDVKMAAAKIGTKTSIDVNANTPKSASSKQMNVTMKTVKGKLQGSDLTSLMKGTKIKRPVIRTIPTNMFPESLATTIAKEDIAEHGKKKINPSHDVPLRGTGSEIKKSFVIKPSRRKNK